MTPRPKASTKEKTAENRQRILESAIDTFAEGGFDGANMREIARRAGVNKYMLYYHFEDKKTLFEQVLETVTRPLFARLTLTIEEAPDLEAALGNVFDIYGELFASRQGRLRAFLARELAAGAPRIGPVLRLRAPDIIRLWESKLAAHVGRDDLPYQDVVRTVVSIMSTIVATFLTEPALQNILDVYGLAVRDPNNREHVIGMIMGGVQQRLAL